MTDLKNWEPASNFALKRAKNGNNILIFGVVFQVENSVTSDDRAKCLGSLLMSKQAKMRIK